MNAVLRLLAATLAVGLVLAACASDDTDDEVAGPADQPSDAFPDGPSALDDMEHDDFPEPLVEPAEVISGGPPPDGIPPIDDPQFVDVEEADEWLEPAEPVVAVDIDGDARAYPVQILTWHEIVNDVVGDRPVAVTYCPLCNTAVSFERTIDGEETTFGTSGRLFASALVMYDRATESLWTHFDGRAIIGVLTGSQLEIIPSPLVSWEEFATVNPDGQVLDRERTGFSRAYGTNPYTGYDDPASDPFLFQGDVDERASAMQRVVGVERGDETKAWPLDVIVGDGAEVTAGEVGGDDVVILWKAGQASALEDSDVAGGRDVGSVGVFLPVVDGEELTFTVSDGEFVDDQTGSTWSVTGRAVAGELEDAQLQRLHHFDTFWFAWSAYQPDTILVEETS